MNRLAIPIGSCSTCGTVIPATHPYSWCSECGTTLPAETNSKLDNNYSRGFAESAARAPAIDDAGFDPWEMVGVVALGILDFIERMHMLDGLP
jgi:hypothetical protein